MAYCIPRKGLRSLTGYRHLAILVPEPIGTLLSKSSDYNQRYFDLGSFRHHENLHHTVVLVALPFIRVHSNFHEVLTLGRGSSAPLASEAEKELGVKELPSSDFRAEFSPK
jgi:hypothetical protein